jgi:DNA-binding NtrC family response regulator
MSLLGQAKILRMIECHEVQPLGRKSATPVNIRVIAATNRELDRLTRDGAFRKDLFFRLAVTCIHLPPLRERREDLLDLLNYYIRYYNQRFGRSVRRLSEQAIELIMAYDWPGNVRELKNLVEAIFVDLPSPDTEIADLPAQFRSRCADLEPASNDERARLVRALSAANWNKSKAASGLHWSRMTLYRKMALYKIG